MIKSSEDSKIIWDTTSDPIDYPKEIKIIFFKLFVKNRKKFANWIGSVAVKNFNNIYELIKLPLSRDPYISNLFKNIIVLNILKSTHVRKKKLKTIIFDSKPTAQTFLTTIKNNDIKIVIKKKINKLLKFLNLYIFSFLIFILVKIIKKNLICMKKISYYLILICQSIIKLKTMYFRAEQNLKNKK